ncbi:hypothetical protein [Microcoleus anatoxicus]|uniref:hypothetical protein n=1 Tax=Microcoleus anatoxicus TaxID=2705319 RepID=UPI0030C9C783
MKISPDDFPSPNTFFVRGGGHRLCRRGFQPPRIPTAEDFKLDRPNRPKNPIAHPQKMRSPINQKPDRPSTKNPIALKPTLHHTQR